MRKRDRITALVLATVFFVSTVAFSGLVVWQITQGDKQANNLDNQDANSLTQKENSLEGQQLDGFTPVEKVDNLQIIDLQEGTGDIVQQGATVVAHYTGALAKDGTIFQSSKDMGNPVPFSLNQVIEGWSAGVPGMKVGGKRRLLIPYAMAYGEEGRPSGGIPPQADLVFDIELVAIQ